MADFPVNERIARNLVEALEGIRVVAGYTFDAASVERRKLPDNTTGDCKIIVIGEDPKRMDADLLGTVGRWEATQVFAVLVSRFPADNVEPIECLLNKCWADVVRAVMQDTNRGGDADDTVTLEPIGHDANTVRVPVVVTYTYRKDDPTRNQ